MNLTINEAKRRIRFNNKMFNWQQRSGKFDPTMYYWFDMSPREVSYASIMGKSEDLVAALAIDALPVLKEKTGTDAYIVENNTITPVELKTSYVSYHTIWQSTGRTLYTGTKNEKDKKSQLKSSHEAKYSISLDALETKRMITFLVLLEDRPGSRFPLYIEIVRVEPDVIIELLRERLDNQRKKILKENGKWDQTKARSIGVKFATFESNGTCILGKSKGYSVWEDELRAKVDILTKDEEAQYAIMKSNEKTGKFLNTEIGKNSMHFFGWSTLENNTLQDSDSVQLTKIDPTPQNSSPYTVEHALQRIQDLLETQPIGPCD